MTLTLVDSPKINYANKVKDTYIKHGIILIKSTILQLAISVILYSPGFFMAKGDFCLLQKLSYTLFCCSICSFLICMLAYTAILNILNLEIG